MQEKKLVVVLDDEENILEIIKINLTKEGFDVYCFETPKKFFNFLQEKIPDLIILDIMLPQMDGFEICKKIKSDQRLSSVAIIFLSAKSEEIDKVLGLELGADDYITKPFSVRELIARVKTVLRRQDIKKEGKIIKVGNILFINPETYEVYVEDEKIDLTTTEFKLLLVLAENKNKVLTRDKLLDYLWGTQKAVIDRTIDVHITHLREKLKKAGKFIKNIRGVGYKISE
ncbi:MAG: response regulator transcription factor [Candidatus Omnitrophica bacterium]|nr:response regulator transcription factor [Candidatus Omnitrophota bacterium]